MFENLSERLERSFKILKGEGKITELNVAETLKDVRRALLEADVNYNVAKKFTEDVKEKALGQDVLTAVRPGELMVKIVHDELANLMGGKAAELNLTGMPAIILMSGLQGSGKTTFSGKLANLLKTKQGKKPMLVAGDVYRPAAIEQLRVLAGQLDVPVFFDLDSKDPVSIARRGVAEAMGQGCDVVIIDTAGRLAVDEEMMREIEEIKRAIRPSETLFVVDSMTGQDAVNTAKTFNERLDFDGVSSPSLTGTPAVVLPSPSVPSLISRSSSSGWARRWMHWMSSTPIVWPTVSSAWVISSHLSSVPSSSTMSAKLSASRSVSLRISLTSMTSSPRSSRSRRWVTSRILQR